ncbi:hypothetical protein ABIB54_001985 [Frigoribacterium sp. UYMn621]
MIRGRVRCVRTSLGARTGRCGSCRSAHEWKVLPSRFGSRAHFADARGLRFELPGEQRPADGAQRWSPFLPGPTPCTRQGWSPRPVPRSWKVTPQRNPQARTCAELARQTSCSPAELSFQASMAGERRNPNGITSTLTASGNLPSIRIPTGCEMAGWPQTSMTERGAPLRFHRPGISHRYCPPDRQCRSSAVGVCHRSGHSPCFDGLRDAGFSGACACRP